MTDFIVSNVKRINKNTLIGSFDLQTPSGFIFRGMMYFESHCKRWVNFPSKEFKSPENGQREFFPFIDFASRDRREKFQALVVPIAAKALSADRD
jgi:hypothetical protein